MTLSCDTAITDTVTFGIQNDRSRHCFNTTSMNQKNSTKK